MKIPIVNHKDYLAKINVDNKFPINKFNELAKYLIKKNLVNEFYKPYPCSLHTLNRAHSKDYIYRVKNKTLNELAQKKIGFPLNDSIVQRSFIATGGTVLASKLAINFGLACNTAGGSHHASFDEGAGFCVFNDVAVAAKYLQNKGYARRILIVDLDNTAGFLSSFLDEAFGSLVYDFGAEEVRKRLKIVSQEEPDWVEMIMNDVVVDWEKRRKSCTQPTITVEHDAWFRLKKGKIIKHKWIEHI